MLENRDRSNLNNSNLNKRHENVDGLIGSGAPLQVGLRTHPATLMATGGAG